jgi:RHS repeat-associated protein
VYITHRAHPPFNESATGHVGEYECDHRNRLVKVIERASEGGAATQVVQHGYDYLNRWVGRAVDSDGDGPLGFDDTYFIYDGTPGNSLSPWERVGVRAVGTEGLLDAVGQIVLQFDDAAQGTPQLTHRYLWGAAVDQILADEQVSDPASEGDILWPLTDHLGTVRDLAEYDDVTDTTTVVNHRVYDAFGSLVNETAAVDHLFAFTGRAVDEETGLQNNLNRWYDAEVGRWLNEDPIGFEGGDANLCRYVGNSGVNHVDPTGLSWKDWVPFLGTLSRWGESFDRRAAERDRLATVIARGDFDSVDAMQQARANALGGALEGAVSASELAVDAAMTAPMLAGAIVGVGSRLRSGASGAPGMTSVCRWGRGGLETGDWVMKGGKNIVNYVFSGKWQPGFTNQFAPYGSGQMFVVPSHTLVRPGGFWGPIKHLLGHRIYVGAGLPLP